MPHLRYWISGTIHKRRLTPGWERAAGSAVFKDLARELGFNQVGIVAAEALTEEGLRLQQWLARGFHGEMKWLSREPSQRSDPRQLFPEAKSVIVVALNYYTPHAHQGETARVSGGVRVSTGSGSDRVEHHGSASSRTGKVSRYAWGDDYHEIVRDKLH